MRKRVITAVAAASLSFGASGCAALGAFFDVATPSETDNEAVVCDDTVDPDCAPDRDVIIVDE